MTLSYKLGMAQIRVDGGRPEPNLARAVAMIRSAARAGCAVVVLPECLDLGWTHPSARTAAEPVPGPRSALLAEAARRDRIYVVAGLTERDGSRVYNAAVLLSPQGEILLKHRKINELDIAAPFYDTGDRLGVARTEIGTIALDICADNFPDSLDLARSMARMGAQVLLSPSAWAVDPGYDNARNPYGAGLWDPAYTALARCHGLHVIGVSCVGALTAGPWAGKHCIGSSLAIGPPGVVLARGPFGEHAESLTVVDIQLAPHARLSVPDRPEGDYSKSL